jgi:MFS family permease
MLVLLLKEPAPEPAAKQPFSWTLQGFPAAYKRYLLTLALFTLGNSSNMFLLLRARDMGLSPGMVPVLWALTSASAMLLSTPLSGLSDKIGRNRLIISGWAVYGLFYLLLGLSRQLWLLWPLFAFYGVFMAATEGAEKALVADIAPREMLGTAYGWFNLIGSIMLLPASMIFGWLWQTFSPQLAFTFSASCSLLAALLLKTWVIQK